MRLHIIVLFAAAQIVDSDVSGPVTGSKMAAFGTDANRANAVLVLETRVSFVRFAACG